jgi:hypothetical protein
VRNSYYIRPGSVLMKMAYGYWKSLHTDQPFEDWFKQLKWVDPDKEYMFDETFTIVEEREH